MISECNINFHRLKHCRNVQQTFGTWIPTMSCNPTNLGEEVFLHLSNHRWVLWQSWSVRSSRTCRLLDCKLAWLLLQCYGPSDFWSLVSCQAVIVLSLKFSRPYSTIALSASCLGQRTNLTLGLALDMTYMLCDRAARYLNWLLFYIVIPTGVDAYNRMFGSNFYHMCLRRILPVLVQCSNLFVNIFDGGKIPSSDLWACQR